MGRFVNQPLSKVLGDRTGGYDGRFTHFLHDKSFQVPKILTSKLDSVLSNVCYYFDPYCELDLFRVTFSFLPIFLFYGKLKLSQISTQ